MNKEEIINLSNKNIRNVLDDKGIDLKGFNDREISKLINSDKSYVVIGLRRIGKTKLLEEAIRSFFKSSRDVLSTHQENEKVKETKTNINEKSVEISNFKTSSISLLQKKILYFKFDSIEFQVLSEKEKNDFLINLKDLIVYEEYSLLLLDEIQATPYWPILLKDIFDANRERKSLRFIATGSNSNQLIEKNEHGIGRWSNMIFGIPTFKEMKSITANNLSLSTYIDWQHFPAFSKQEYDGVVYEAVIEKSFASTKHNQTTLLKVLKSIVKHIGSEVNPNRISKNSGINKTHMNDYISSLEKSQLVFKLTNFHLANTNFKLVTLIPSLYRLFFGLEFNELSNDQKGHLFENFIIIEILSKLTLFSSRVDVSYYRKDNKEIDLILKDTAIEIKYSETIDINDIRKYVEVTKIIDYSKLIIIYCGKTRDIEEIDGVKIKLLNRKDIDNVKWR